MLILNGQDVQAQARATAPDNWCADNTPWKVVDLAQAPNPGCKQAGVVALDVNGDVDRYNTFAEAEAARAGRNATFFYELSATEPATATPVPATQQNTNNTGNSGEGVAAGQTLTFGVTEDLTPQEVDLLGQIDWGKWLSGGTAIVFSEAEGTLNTGTLMKLQPTNLPNGVIVVLEPWRPGCGSTLKDGIPQSKDPNCNPGAAWLFTNWEDAMEWLAVNEWTEASLWFRPGDSITKEAQKTCVSALTPAGTAINIAPDRTQVWQVCPDGFSDPDWVVQGMWHYVAVQDLVEENARLEKEVAELRALRATFCAANLDHDICSAD